MDRGVHLVTRGNTHNVIETPALRLLHCRRCHKPGVSVTALWVAPETGKSREGFWCSVRCAFRDGWPWLAVEPEVTTKKRRNVRHAG